MSRLMFSDSRREETLVGIEAQRARIAAGPPCGILVGDDPLAFSVASVLMRGSAGSAS